MRILEKMVSGGERILNIIKPTINYDIPIIDRASSSELSNVPKDFKNITVNNNNIIIKKS